MIFNFFLGLLIIIGAILSIQYNYEVVNALGRNNIFERKLGPGASYPAFKFIAILAIILGLLIMTSMLDNVLEMIFGPAKNSLFN